MTTLGICMNLKNRALSQYTKYNFNSMCVFDGVLLGANTSGIFTCDGEHDNTVDISAYFSLGASDFGIFNSKKIRTVYLSGYSAGDISVTILTDNQERTVYYKKSVGTTKERTMKFNINAEHGGRYISFKVANVSGSDFSIDALDAMIIATVIMHESGDGLGRLKGILPTMEITASAT
jgi:hypothetical protein